jgi:LPS-assembly protein
LEENGKIGTSNTLASIYRYKLDDNNLLEYSTRRNRELNLTEYYDLTYEYENDCLTAGIRYKKKFYKDGDIKPSEELFFTITIIPLGTFSPDAITRTN